MLIILMAVIKFFKYNAKLLGNTFADGGNGILRNTTTALQLRWLSSSGIDNFKFEWFD